MSQIVRAALETYSRGDLEATDQGDAPRTSAAWVEAASLNTPSK
jgi:hypothetical protein